MGPNPLTADPFRETIPLTLGAWRDKSALTGTATTEPDFVSMAGVFGMKWDHGGTTTDHATLSFTMPFEFSPNAPLKQDIKLSVVARKLDAASDENAGLFLQAGMSWFTPGEVDNPRQDDPSGTVPVEVTAAGTATSLTTPAKVLLAAATVAAVNTASGGFHRYELDLGARLRAEEKSIKAGDIVHITLAPNGVSTTTVGTTDMDLEIAGAPILILRREEQIAEALRLQRDVHNS